MSELRASAMAAVLASRQRWCVVGGVDCREVLRWLPDNGVDHVIMDPPYSKHVHTRSRRGVDLPDTKAFACRERRKRELGFEHLDPRLGREVAYQAARLAKRWSMAFTDTESANLWRAWFQHARLDYVRTAIWLKVGGTPQFTGDRPAVAHEDIVVAHRPEEAARDDIVVAHRTGRKRWNGGGKLGVYAVPIELDRLGRGKVERVHTTQKPLDLMLRLVADFTDPDDIVLDPFCGSATTGVACLRLGRRFIGIERNPHEAEKAVERLRAEEAGVTPRELRAGQTVLDLDP
jgi:site-specific DNA-methyltransferase (adenine-specific)